MVAHSYKARNPRILEPEAGGLQVHNLCGYVSSRWVEVA